MEKKVSININLDSIKAKQAVTSHAFAKFYIGTEQHFLPFQAHAGHSVKYIRSSSTIWARLFLLFRHDRPFAQEVVQAGAMTTKRVIGWHESEKEEFDP